MKKDAIVAIAFPGMKYELYQNIPEEMKTLWDDEALEMWHSIEWWKPKFEKWNALIRHGRIGFPVTILMQLRTGS